jgi:hypothetical protein
MAAAIGLRDGCDGAALRTAARLSIDRPQARGLLAFGAIYEGATRTEAAMIRDVG